MFEKTAYRIFLVSVTRAFNTPLSPRCAVFVSFKVAFNLTSGG